MRTLLILMLLTTAGCVSYTIDITDMGPYPGSTEWASGYKFSSRDQTLIIEVENPGGVKIVKVSPLVYDGDLYLQTLAISGVGPTRFEIDVAPLDLGPDWTERVYLYAGSWDNGILALGGREPLPQHTRRWRVVVLPLKETGRSH